MEHSVYTAEVKDAARAARRSADKQAVTAGLRDDAAVDDLTVHLIGWSFHC